MRRFAFLLLLARAAAVFALPPMPAAYRTDAAAALAAGRTATADRFPDADTVILANNMHAAYEPDGSDVSWDDEWVKILTEKGRRDYARLQVDYPARYGDAEIQCVEIVGTDGTIRPVDFAATLKTATDNSSLAMNIVDPLDKTMRCSVPGLAVGEIRHVVVCRRTRKAFMRDAWGDVKFLEGHAPIVRTRVTVDSPAARPLAKAELFRPCGATVRRAPDRVLSGGRTLQTWDVRDVPRIFSEPAMPELRRCVQTLVVSTVPDWETVSKWYWGLCEPHLAKTTPAMADLVRCLTRNAPDASAKIRALFRFVSQEIRYMGLTLEEDSPGFEPHDVDVTFDNRYGVCRDKAALLVALLRLAGVEAYPVLIHVGARRDAGVALPYFNHAIVYAGGLLMDPTNEATRDLLPGYLSNRSYLVARPDGDTLRVSPVAPSEENQLRVEAHATLAADASALYTATLRFGGVNDTQFRHALLQKTPVRRRRLFEDFLRELAPGAELLSLEVTPRDLRATDEALSARLVARLPELVLRGETHDELALPLLSRAVDFAGWMLDGATALETRRFPIELFSTVGADETLEVDCADALGAPSFLPSDVAVTNAPGFQVRRTMTAADGRLVVRRRVDVSAVEFPVSAYEALRAARKEAETRARARPRFAKDVLADAHLRTRLDRTVVRLRGPTSWCVTNTVEREVLTYRGKKSAAELSFDYVPSVRTLTLVSATVSNRNGKVFSVTPKEINEMDANRVAAAPRYPGARRLIVNLPGVEIGSTVRYTVAEDVTHAPVAYTAAWSFDSTQPLDCREVELYVPDTVPLKIAAHGRTGSRRRVEGGTLHVWRAERPSRVPDEPGMPHAELWRSTVRVSAADWRAYGRALDAALAAARAAGSSVAFARARELTADPADPAARITAVRTWLAHHVRVAGPGLFEVPFERAFTPPDRALAEGYASRADYRNLLYAMLEAAGFDCTFVLADSAPDALPAREEAQRDCPNPRWFDALVVRAEERPPWWCPWARGRVFWVGGENEHTPPEATDHAAELYFEPSSGRFGRIPRVAAPARPEELTAAGTTNWCAATWNTRRLTVRANGATDFDVTNRLYGAATGAFRRRFAEMLPEPRQRYHQQLTGALAENATATSELVTDTVSYPALTAYSAYVEGFATAEGDMLSVTLPAFGAAPFPDATAARRAPLYVSGKDPVWEDWEVVFPAGYVQVEHLPPAFAFGDPCAAGGSDWTLAHDVKTERDADGRLHVHVRRRTVRPKAHVVPCDYCPVLRDWNRRAAALAARTITIRKM